MVKEKKNVNKSKIKSLLYNYFKKLTKKELLDFFRNHADIFILKEKEKNELVRAKERNLKFILNNFEVEEIILDEQKMFLCFNKNENVDALRLNKNSDIENTKIFSKGLNYCPFNNPFKKIHQESLFNRNKPLRVNKNILCSK